MFVDSRQEVTDLLLAKLLPLSSLPVFIMRTEETEFK